MEEQTTKAGLLFAAAQAHQVLAESTLQRLAAYTQDLEAVVRGEVRRVLAEELQFLSAQARDAVASLNQVKRAASLRAGAWNLATLAAGTLITFAAAWWLSPSRAEVAQLRARRDQLSISIAELERQGGGADLRRCGQQQRLCVRVDRKAPAFGVGADYFVVRGY